MDLKLDSDVVYAILAAIVAIVFIVNVTKIVRWRWVSKQETRAYPYDQAHSTWPKVTGEK